MWTSSTKFASVKDVGVSELLVISNDANRRWTAQHRLSEVAGARIGHDHALNCRAGHRQHWGRRPDGGNGCRKDVHLSRGCGATIGGPGDIHLVGNRLGVNLTEDIEDVNLDR